MDKTCNFHKNARTHTHLSLWCNLCHQICSCWSLGDAKCTMPNVLCTQFFILQNVPNSVLCYWCKEQQATFAVSLNCWNMIAKLLWGLGGKRAVFIASWKQNKGIMLKGKLMYCKLVFPTQSLPRTTEKNIMSFRKTATTISICLHHS